MVILADEPTGALDTASGKEVMQILAELHAAEHTVIIVTHDPKVAANAQRIVEVSDGEIVSDTRNTGPELPSDAPIEPKRSGARRLVASGVVQGSVQHGLGRAGVPPHAHLADHAGIVIGITSVVSISAIGEGAKRYVLKDIRRLAATPSISFPAAVSATAASAIETLLPSDVEALNQLYYVDSATPVVGRHLLLRLAISTWMRRSMASATVTSRSRA